MEKKEKKITKKSEEKDNNLDDIDIGALINEVNLLKQELDNLKHQKLRDVAEMENLRKRCDKQVEEAKDYAVVNFAKDLLIIVDNLNRALVYKEEDPVSKELQSVLDGVKLTNSELEKVFQKYHINIISPKTGDKFDYSVHHAISQVKNDEYEAGTIMEVMQTGYKIKDRLLRPAIVSVSVKNE